MPSLDSSIIQKIVRLLVPLMEREDQRRALLTLAMGQGAPVLRQISYTGPIDTFLVNMINVLARYGEVEPGKQALWALLEVVRDRVGVDRQVEIDVLYPVVNSPLRPFDGKTLQNWVGRPPGCWQAINSQICGVGNDPLTFSDPDTPIDLQYASLLTWEGLAFCDGDVAARVWVPLVGRGGAGGLVLRNVKERSALIGLLRQVQPDHSLALELWCREGACLRLIQSVFCPPAILITGWCQLTFKVHRNSASISAASDSHPDEVLALCNASVLLDDSPGYFGLIKFSSGAVSLADLRLTVYI